jgi:HEAT repeats
MKNTLIILLLIIASLLILPAGVLDAKSFGSRRTRQKTGTVDNKRLMAQRTGTAQIRATQTRQLIERRGQIKRPEKARSRPRQNTRSQPRRTVWRSRTTPVAPRQNQPVVQPARRSVFSRSGRITRDFRKPDQQKKVQLRTIHTRKPKARQPKIVNRRHTQMAPQKQPRLYRQRERLTRLRRSHYSRRHNWHRVRQYPHYYPRQGYGFGISIIRLFGCDYLSCYLYRPWPETVIIHEPVVVERHVIVREPETIIVQEADEGAHRQEKLIGQLLLAQPDDRESAACELSQFEGVAVVAALVDAMINDAEVKVRTASAVSLGKIADPLAFEALIRSSMAEQDKAAIEAATVAVQNIRDKMGQEQIYVSERFPPMNEGKPELGRYLEDLRLGSADQRRHAAKELRNYIGTQAVAALTNTLINDPDESVREETAESLGKITDRMALPFLEAARLSDPDKDVREEADEAIDKIRNCIR